MTTVIVAHRSPAGIDSNGDPVPSTTTTTTLTGVTMAPQEPVEENDRVRDGAVVRYVLRCPIDTTIARGDTVTWRDDTFRVHTVPQIWEDPFPGPKVEGLEVTLQRVEVAR